MRNVLCPAWFCFEDGDCLRKRSNARDSMRNSFVLHLNIPRESEILLLFVVHLTASCDITWHKHIVQWIVWWLCHIVTIQGTKSQFRSCITCFVLAHSILSCLWFFIILKDRIFDDRAVQTASTHWKKEMRRARATQNAQVVRRALHRLLFILCNSAHKAFQNAHISFCTMTRGPETMTA